jgi:hypothetical protein
MTSSIVWPEMEQMSVAILTMTVELGQLSGALRGVRHSGSLNDRTLRST